MEVYIYLSPGTQGHGSSVVVSSARVERFGGVKMSCKSDKWATFVRLWSTGAGTMLPAKQLIAQRGEGPTKYS